MNTETAFYKLEEILENIRRGKDIYGQGKDVQRYQDYVIYGAVVKTWTKAHKEPYWLERWKLKRKEIDHTFWFERKYYPPDVL